MCPRLLASGTMQAFVCDPDCVKTPIYAKYGLHKAICQVLWLLFAYYFVFGFYPVKT
jgi:hypothetical protein